MAHNATNAATQARLRKLMMEAREQGFNFSAAGMHYLACRVNGSRYRKPILAGFELMLAGKLKDTVPAPMIESAKKALNRKELPDEALIIFATGRKPLLNATKTHWQEEQVSLLTPFSMSEEYVATLDATKKKKYLEAVATRAAQKESCETLMEFLSNQYDLKYPAKPASEPVKKAKKSNVVKLTPKAPMVEKEVGEITDLRCPMSAPDPDPEEVMAMYGIEPSVFEIAPEPMVVEKKTTKAAHTTTKAAKSEKNRKVAAK